MGMLWHAVVPREAVQRWLAVAQAARSGGVAAFRLIGRRTRGSRESMSIMGARETYLYT